MPYFKTSNEWFEQSLLLLKARPTSTRVTSKYSVLKPTASKIAKRQRYTEKQAAKSATATRATSPPPAAKPDEPTATFTLKTYDPVSGTCLQYETTKAAEVGRLVGGMGRLARGMAALPDSLDDLSMPAAGEGVATPNVDEGGDTNMGGMPIEPKTAIGGAKKKKKGKK